jgi:hypothetical protein
MPTLSAEETEAKVSPPPESSIAGKIFATSRALPFAKIPSGNHEGQPRDQYRDEKGNRWTKRQGGNKEY